MAEVKTDQEPSIEEILESIRQIISEDDVAPEQAAAPVKAEEAPPPPPKPAPKPAPVPTPEPEPEVLDLTDRVEVPASAVEIALEDTEESDDGMGLISDEAVDASAAAMAKLLAGNVAVERDVPSRTGKVTLEDMARDLMRPMIKIWLEQNLPSITEKMVAKEIEKVSRLAHKK